VCWNIQQKICTSDSNYPNSLFLFKKTCLVGAANNYVTSACKSYTFCQNIPMIQGKILQWQTEHRSPSSFGYVNRHLWKQVMSLPSAERREPANLCTCLLCRNFFLKAVGRQHHMAEGPSRCGKTQPTHHRTFIVNATFTWDLQWRLLMLSGMQIRDDVLNCQPWTHSLRSTFLPHLPSSSHENNSLPPLHSA
jgi:hypothetical protein